MSSQYSEVYYFSENICRRDYKYIKQPNKNLLLSACEINISRCMKKLIESNCRRKHRPFLSTLAQNHPIIIINMAKSTQLITLIYLIWCINIPTQFVNRRFLLDVINLVVKLICSIQDIMKIIRHNQVVINWCRVRWMLSNFQHRSRSFWRVTVDVLLYYPSRIGQFHLNGSKRSLFGSWTIDTILT